MITSMMTDLIKSTAKRMARSMGHGTVGKGTDMRRGRVYDSEDLVLATALEVFWIG